MINSSNDLLDIFWELIQINCPTPHRSKKWTNKIQITKIKYRQNPSIAQDVIQQHQTLMDFLSFIGSPHNKFKVIHISGTSGKGSTATLISRLLTDQGIPNGLFITPYVYDIRETFQLDSKLVASTKLQLYLDEFVPLVRDFLTTAHYHLTYHDLRFAFACYLFAKEKIKIAVIECFMGGRFDTTNLFQRPDKTCVITAIGKDHENFLGNTAEDIIWHKSGIVKPHNHLVLGRSLTPPQIQLIKDNLDLPSDHIHTPNLTYSAINQTHTWATLQWSGQHCQIPLAPHQMYLLPNLPTAFKACQVALKPETISFTDIQWEQILAPLPARLETHQILTRGHKIKLLLDGAHNTQKISFLQSQLDNIYPDQKYILLFSTSKGEQALEMLQILQPVSSTIIASTFQVELSTNQKLKESVQLLQTEQDQLNTQYTFVSQPNKALRLAIKQAITSNLPILCTGSFYFVGLIKTCLEEYQTPVF